MTVFGIMGLHLMLMLATFVSLVQNNVYSLRSDAAMKRLGATIVLVFLALSTSCMSQIAQLHL